MDIVMRKGPVLVHLLVHLHHLLQWSQHQDVAFCNPWLNSTTRTNIPERLSSPGSRLKAAPVLLTTLLPPRADLVSLSCSNATWAVSAPRVEPTSPIWPRPGGSEPSAALRQARRRRRRRQGRVWSPRWRSWSTPQRPRGKLTGRSCTRSTTGRRGWGRRACPGERASPVQVRQGCFWRSFTTHCATAYVAFVILDCLLQLLLVFDLCFLKGLC